MPVKNSGRPSAAQYRQALRAARSIRMLITDVDGVLTDGGLYYDIEGNITKRFNVHDGLGIRVAQAAGLEVGVMSGLASNAVEKRVRELGIEEYFAGFKKKDELLHDLCERRSLTLHEIAYLGDDWVDAKAMRIVGLSAAVANAQPDIRRRAMLVTRANGGEGALREFIRFILRAQGALPAQWARVELIMRRVVIILGLLLLVAGGGFWYLYLENKTVDRLERAAKEIAKEAGELDIQADVGVDLSLKGIKLSHGKEGQLHWKLTAQKAKYLQDQSEVQVEQPEIVYFFENDDRQLSVKAAKGLIEQEKEKARLWPEITARYGDMRLRADELEYSGKERELVLRGNVQLETPKLSCQAVEMRYGLERNDITARNGIHATISLDDMNPELKERLNLE